MDVSKKLYKNKRFGKIFGVCAGFAEYLNADVTLIRVLWILLTLATFSLGFWAYIACALIMPDKSEVIDYFQNRN